MSDNGTSYDPNEPIRPRVPTVPFDDLEATNPPDFWLPIAPHILPVLASLVAQGPDKPRLLETDALNRLLTATSVNPQVKQTQAVPARQGLMVPDNASLLPPGTVVLLQNASKQSELTTIKVNNQDGSVTFLPTNIYAYAIGDPITIIPDMEVRSTWRYVNDMVVSPVSTATMDCVLEAGTKCILVAGRSAKTGAPVTNCTITGDQTGTQYYNAASLPGTQQPIKVDAADDVSVTVSVTCGSGSPAGTAVFCYASFSNDIQYVQTITGNPLTVTPSGGVFDTRPRVVDESRVHVPAISTQATVTFPAVAGRRYEIAYADIKLVSNGAADVHDAVIRDGASGVGTVLWDVALGVTASQGSNDIARGPAGLTGTVGNALTVETTGALANTYQRVAAGVYYR